MNTAINEFGMQIGEMSMDQLLRACWEVSEGVLVISQTARRELEEEAAFRGVKYSEVLNLGPRLVVAGLGVR